MLYFKLHLNLVIRNFFRPKSYALNQVGLYFI
ncbi:hypothetical protein T02_1083 [Trichinella nativa]|uniref:Uncharacterized protein n=2 Tax=Trichinella TaxID=6333 RepID=A0A0V1KIC1_9BILA|nr:hypothetical protein T05_8822 [Trichinella murrelli]KRZ46973.1 hypothetical protein T02_1083 [Trichinella nativa]